MGHPPLEIRKYLPDVDVRARNPTSCILPVIRLCFLKPVGGSVGSPRIGCEFVKQVVTF